MNYIELEDLDKNVVSNKTYFKHLGYNMSKNNKKYLRGVLTFYKYFLSINISDSFIW